MSMKAVEIEVYGRVQGVFFRDTTKRKARELGLVGWVKNRPDGSVLVYAEGENAKIELLADFCKKGPDMARVERVSLTVVEAKGLESFEIAF